MLKNNMNPRCAAAITIALTILAPKITATTAKADDWPQWRGPDRDGVWSETGIVDKFDSPHLKPIWRAEIAGGYSGPTIAEGRVFLTDRITKPVQMERVHCFDAATGRKIWTHAYKCSYRNVSYDTGPRASVLIENKRAFSLGAMGNLFCFNATSGTVLWSHDLNRKYKIRMPIWGIAAAPIIEDNLIITHIGGENNACLVAFDKITGKEAWHALSDKPSYSAPIVIDQAGLRVLVCWTGENVVGLNPATGKVYWSHPYKQRRMVIGIATPVVQDNHLLVSGFFDGSLLLRLHYDKPDVSKVWLVQGEDEMNTRGLHSIISTPIIKNGHIYGCCAYGELRCLDLKTGDRIWESLEAVPRARWATMHFIEHDEETWIFNERGDLIISRLSPDGYHEISRTHIFDPTTGQLNRRGGVCWTHPAFAGRKMYVRNDKELLCVDLAK